jgi:PAS domain-containing protein
VLVRSVVRDHRAMRKRAKLRAERERAHAELAQSEARFRNLTELSSDYYWEQDGELRFVTRVGRADDPSAPPLETVLGKMRWELPCLNLTAADWAAHRADLKAHREFRHLELERPGPAGATRWISTSGRPIFDAEGRFRGYCGNSTPSWSGGSPGAPRNWRQRTRTWRRFPIPWRTTCAPRCAQSAASRAFSKST